jgi:hypothetical protein
MKQEIFKSSRYFTMFDFIISHGQLLLRSQKSEETNNIDIVFYNTTYIQMFSRLKSICINMILNAPDIIEYSTVREYLDFENNHLFELESNNEIYFIAASFVRVFDNSLAFNESSLHIEEGRKIEIATSLNV